MQVKTLFILSVLIALCGISEPYASPVYFLVAETPGAEVHQDSYVLPLDALEDIAHARDLIAKGPGIGNAIVVVEIAAGADGINRDYRARGAPVWSWHVSEFEGFHDITAEILDGWPSFVESDVQGWIANTGGLIGFWSYTIVDELENPSIPAPGTLLLLLIGLGSLTLLRGWRTSSPIACLKAYYPCGFWLCCVLSIAKDYLIPLRKKILDNDTKISTTTTRIYQ